MVDTIQRLPPTVKTFLFAHGASAFALGIHQVLLAWISISVLNLSSLQLGWVQAAGLLPNLLLMLFSGALADRRGPVKIMLFAQALLVLCYVFLCSIIAFKDLTLTYLIAYAIGVGCANAFIQPAREKLIGELSKHSVQTKITRASIVRLSMQAAGVLFASVSDHTGLVLVIMVQLGFCILGLVQLFSLSKKLGAGSPVCYENRALSSAKVWHLVHAGLKVAASDTRILQLLALISFNGFMHMGLYLVAIPMLAREVYLFNALEYGALQFCFAMGMLASYVLILLKKQIEYPAQGALFSLLYTAIVGYSLSKTPTVTGLFVIIAFWGWIAGHSATHCRMIMQILAKAEYRGRLMAMYQFLLFGMAPLGAVGAGYFLNDYSPTELFYFLSLASISVFVVFLFTKSIWSVKQQSPDR